MHIFNSATQIGLITHKTQCLWYTAKGVITVLFQNNKYTLYNKDTKILDFHCDRNDAGEVDFAVDRNYTNDSRLPYNFQDINFWVGNRRAPRNREHIENILRECGCLDLEGFIRFTYCASLNDTFWVKPQESKLTWDNVSLYKNRFDETIAKIAFDGGLMGKHIGTATPELITDGTVAKCWRRFGDDIFLLKRGMKLSQDQDVYGLGPYSEKYTYELAKNICHNPLEYSVLRYHGKIASKCACFCDEKTSYAPISYILGEKAKLSHCLDYFDSIGYGENFREMMVLDALTFNEDRHLKNFGVFYNADSMEVIGMAPVFDNNLAFFPNHKTQEMQNLDIFLTNRVSHFGMSFDDLAKKCMTPNIKKRLITLQGFKFERGGKYALDDERLDILETIIERQIDIALNRKVYMVEQNNRAINVQSISFEFNKDNIPEEALNILLSNEFEVSDFDVVTESNEVLHIYNCKSDAIDLGSAIFLDIYNADVSGKSESMIISNIAGFSIVSKNTAEEIQLKSNDINIQLGDEANIAQSNLENVMVNIIQECTNKTERSDHNVDAKTVIKQMHESNKAGIDKCNQTTKNVSTRIEEQSKHGETGLANVERN